MKYRKKLTGETEIDLKPFMNIIVTLIPVLLISAEFAKMAVIDLKLPKDTGSDPSISRTEPKEGDQGNKLRLTAIVTDSVVTLGAKGGFLPSLFYKEYHTYAAKDDHAQFTVEYKAGDKVLHPKTKREMTKYERNEVQLYVTDDHGKIVQTLYSKSTRYMLTDAAGSAVSSVKPGDTVFMLTSPRIMTVVKNPADYALQPMSAYDELKNRLMKVKERYSAADDGSDIIIAAENRVMYDKIIQIMDAARAAEFPNISIAKLRM